MRAKGRGPRPGGRETEKSTLLSCTETSELQFPASTRPGKGMNRKWEGKVLFH